jgi:hypothetical protein
MQPWISGFKIAKEEKLGNKIDLAEVYSLLGWITAFQLNHPKALEYAMKSLERNKELNIAVAILFRIRFS